MTLEDLLDLLAQALITVDRGAPAFVSRTGRQYQAGLGPYSEDAAMKLAVEELRRQGIDCGQFLPYPSNPRAKCDLWFGDPLAWAVEVKMARFRGDNGKPDDTGIKDVLSPFSADRSALTDALKLRHGGFPCHRALVVYGFDDPTRPLDEIMWALRTLLFQVVDVGEQPERRLEGLAHPVFSSGSLFGFEIVADATPA